MGKITITELVDRANGYHYGLAGYGGSVSAHILFNEVAETENVVTFRQINQDDVNISLNKEEITAIKDKSSGGSACYKIYMKSGAIISIFLFQERGGEAQACHMLYGSYDDYLKELDLNELEKRVKKAKKAFVFISDSSMDLKRKYEHIRLEDMDITDGTRKLVLFNGDDEDSDRISFTLYDENINDIWLMSGADGWEGIKLRLFNQPFTEVKISLLYK